MENHGTMGPGLRPAGTTTFGATPIHLLSACDPSRGAATGGAETRVILTREQIVDLMRVFFPERPNEVMTEEKIESAVAKVVDLGFLRPLKSEPPAFEVRRIVKALVDADWLAGVDEKLKAYQDYGNATA